MKVIGLVGHAGSGKDTAMNVIVRNTPYIFYKVEIVRFADKLKDTVATVMGISREELDRLKEEDRNSEIAKTIREYLQNIGECSRKIDPDIFVNDVVTRIHRLSTLDHPELVIVPDVRFINEAQALKNNFDTVLIKIENPRLDLADEIYQHSSESEIDAIEVDYKIVNDKSLPEFKRDVIDLVFGKIFHKKELTYG